MGWSGRYAAGAARAPFFVLRSYVGSDMLEANPLIKVIDDPYGSGKIAVVPPLSPDVAIIHAQRADRQGNTQLWGLLGMQKEVAFASKNVIVAVEELVDESVIRADPNRTLIPGLIVNAVVHEPYGAHPSYVQGYYDRDNESYLDWDKLSQDQAAVEAWLAEWVYGLENHAAYVRKVGQARFHQLKPEPLLSAVGGLREVSMSEVAYTPSEMMIVTAAHALSGARTVFVGVGLPNIACNLAQRTVAPDMELIYESGVYGARPERLPLSIGDPTLVSGATSVVSMADLFGLYLQRGLVEIALLGGAQVDRYGNLNSTVIGDYAKPKTRLPGSGGACEIATNARRTFMIMRLKRRAFVEKLDFVTSPGHLTGGDSRARLGLPGGGPELMITDKAILRFDNPQREMQLSALYPGVTVSDVQAEVGWPLRLAARIDEVSAPSAEDLRLIRDELDPAGMYR